MSVGEDWRWAGLGADGHDGAFPGGGRQYAAAWCGDGTGSSSGTTQGWQTSSHHGTLLPLLRSSGGDEKREEAAKDQYLLS